jgi:AcrR family transcriptional regulator
MRSIAEQRMSRPNDARALRSREALKNALLELIEERSFEQIAIRDITNRAGVSYPVFFRRYETKENLLDDIAAEEVRRLLTLSVPIFNAHQQQESLRALCGYVDEHRVLWTSLLTGGAGPMMRAEFMRIAKEIGSKEPRMNPWLPTELAASFVVSGLFEILAWWLRQPSDYPIANIVTFIDTLIVRSTARPVDVRIV